DPFEIGAIWKKLYIGTAMNGRRGIVIHAMGAIDMALWDLCGKALGKPVHALLGDGPPRESITPYASLLPGGEGFEGYRDALVEAVARAAGLGARAVTADIRRPGPCAPGGPYEGPARHAVVVAAVRGAGGPQATLIVGGGYLLDQAADSLSI